MLRVDGVARLYRLGGQEIRALDGVSLTIEAGEYLRVLGSSGSGKSTLLNLLGGLDRPTAGRIVTPIGDLADLPRQDLAVWRALHVGMVFQTFNLVSHRTALQNVELGMLFAGVPAGERRRRAEATLAEVGLSDRLQHRPRDLSGGEQQRVALARALAKRPRLLLADEPTGNLDRDNAAQMSDSLARLSAGGMTIILVTHDPALAEGEVHRTIRMSYGKIAAETRHRPVAGPPAAPEPGGGR